MDWHQHIDIYCERVEPGLWAEPLNALANISFFVAAFAAIVLAKKNKAETASIFILIGLIVAIGVGSSLFHTFANTWSKFTDVLPILFFQIWFLVLYCRKIISLKRIATLGLLAVFFLTSFISGIFPYDWLNGSIGYAPAFVFLVGFGIYHFKKQKREPRILLYTAAIFLISLTFRSIDMMICDILSIGIHYMWHILNGIVLYLSARSIVVNYKKNDNV